MECRAPGLRGREVAAKGLIALGNPMSRQSRRGGSMAPNTGYPSESIAKNWARAKAGGLESPAVHERSRESMRRRC